VEKEGRIESLRKAKDLLRRTAEELERAEYYIRLMEKEIEEYRALLDKETLLPKIKLVKNKVERLIERLKFGSTDVLLCVGINLKIKGEIPESDKFSLLKYFSTYLDGRIRPTDILFMVNENTLGIIFILKDRNDVGPVINRLNQMLLHLKAKTYSDRSILVNFFLKHFEVTRGNSAEEVIENLRNLFNGEK